MAATKKYSLSLRVGTYNLHHGKDVDFDMKIIANDILSLSLDIVGIQEADEGVHRSNGIYTMKQLASYTGYNALHFKTINYGGGEYGIGILSRYPIVSYESIPLDSGKLEPRVLSHAVVHVSGQTIDFFNTHLTHNSKPIQLRQFEQIASILSSYKTYILTGDFNTSDLSAFSPLPNASLVNLGQFKSFPETSDAIDNICYSDVFSLISSGMLEENHSDHRAVYAELKR